MKRLLLGLLCLALPLSGCAGAGPVGSGLLELQSASSAPVRVRVGPFVPGHGLERGEILVEEALPPQGRTSVKLPAGRYTIEAVAATAKAETALSSFTLEADRPKTLTLNERFELYQGVQRGAELEQVRLLSWEE